MDTLVHQPSDVQRQMEGRETTQREQIERMRSDLAVARSSVGLTEPEEFRRTAISRFLHHRRAKDPQSALEDQEYAYQDAIGKLQSRQKQVMDSATNRKRAELNVRQLTQRLRRQIAAEPERYPEVVEADQKLVAARAAGGRSHRAGNSRDGANATRRAAGLAVPMAYAIRQLIYAAG